MTRADGAAWRRRALRFALCVALALCFIACWCVEAAAQSPGYRSVQHSAPETQTRPRESHAKTHDEDADEENDNGEDEDDWDFMSDAAILSVAAQQRPSTPAESCATSLPPAYLNDDYCDCDDGSDEPLTSACSHILQADLFTFQCQAGDQRLASAFIGDGVCDCCDGSDEASSGCPNTCTERHEQLLQSLQQRLEAVRTGLHLRDSYSAQYDAKLERLHADMEETITIATAVQRAFNFRQQKLQDAGVQPSPQELHQLEAMYYQMQSWQYQVFVHRKLLESSTFEDKDWKAPFAALVGQCFDYVVDEKQLKGGTANVIPREYLFSFCPFQNVTQSEPSYPEWTIAERRAKHADVPTEDQRESEEQQKPEAPQPILLGVWDQWMLSPSAGQSADDTSHRAQLYDFGHKCANEQHRVVRVDISCAAVNRVVSIEENEMCVYALAFTSPAVCDERDEVRLEREIARLEHIFQSSPSRASNSKARVKAASHEEL